MDVITRLAAFLIAVLLAIDAFSGERTETLHVDRHTRTANWRHDDSYRLHFVGGRVDSCEVGWSAFNALNDGDEVFVDTSRVFKSCDGIRRGDQVIARPWRAQVVHADPHRAAAGGQLRLIQFERRVDDDSRGWWFG